MAEQLKMQNLKDYFAEIRKRPGMYLGENTITKMYDHLQGYSVAHWLNNIENPIDKDFFNNFNEFIYAYYDVVTNDNWRGIILEQCYGNEQTALTTFFELYDLFVSKAKTTSSRKIVLSFFDKLVFEQDDLKVKLGDNFPSVLADTIDLIKDHILINYKADFDFILEELNEKAEGVSELKQVLAELQTNN